MSNANPAPARDESGSVVLGLLADALLDRIENLIGERVERLAANGSPESADDRWLRVAEVAERVGACERTVYRALRSGALAGERLGAHWRIRPAAVDSWLAGSREQPVASRQSSPRAASPSSARPRGTTFTTRARALQGRAPAAGGSTNEGRPGARREEPT
jgi:excisionase family DNA binding protein